MIKGVIVGLIWGIVTISVVVVAFGIGNPPQPQLAEPVSEAADTAEALAATETPASAVPTPVAAAPEASEPKPPATETATSESPTVVAGTTSEPVIAEISAPEQVASLSPPSGSAFSAERPDFTPFVPRQDNAPVTAILPEAYEPATEAPAIPAIDESAEPPAIAETPASPIAPDVTAESQADLGNSHPQPDLPQPTVVPLDIPEEDAGLDVAVTATAEQPEEVAAGPAVGTVPPVPAQPGSGEFAPSVVALPDVTTLPKVQDAVTLQTQDKPDTAPGLLATADAGTEPVEEQQAIAPANRFQPKRLELEAGRAPVVRAEAPDASSDAAPEARTGFRRVVPGVRTDRLPRIASAEVTEASQSVDRASDEAASNPEPVPPSVLPGTPRAGETATARQEGALERNALPFTNMPPLPLVSVILTPGDGSVDAESLKPLPFPVTVALDPNAADAATTAEAYRLAGAEVLVLPVGLPKGATASDMEVSFATFFAAVPTAVGVIDLPEDGFASHMLGAKQVAAILSADGYGMITYGRGLNNAAQEAARLSVPAAQILRVLDDGSDESAMRRNLDRAAFDATQSGATVVVAKASPETLAILANWAQSETTVRLAPVSAVLLAD